MKDAWDRFGGASKNGTFLFQRDYMDYHRDRFDDHSLVIGDGDAPLALLPANEAEGILYSHEGLTYGGLVVDLRMTSPRMIDVFDAVLHYARSQGFSALLYKTVPAIYHRYPAGEDLYALFRAGASLVRRDLLSVVDLTARLPYQERRKRSIRKAQKADLEVRESREWARFWPLLDAVLGDRHGIAPVHSLVEITVLSDHFPNAIRLFSCERRGEILAGTVIYESDMVAHTQYIATTDEGRESGALDLLFDHLIGEVFAAKRYFDFGSSTLDEGRSLNIGLVDQKEGFGARAAVHDFYLIDLASGPRN